MKILVINSGSSSLKYQLIDMENNFVMAKGVCERIGIDGNIKHKSERGELKLEIPMLNHGAAIKVVIDAITSKQHGCIDDLSEISAVGHRVLHGGAKFSDSVLIDDAVIEAIKECIPLGPLHNPANLTGIFACSEYMPNIPQVAVFDTAFHQTIPDFAYLYGIPYSLYEKYQIRRYGFHGTSHRYVSKRAAEMLGKDIKGLKIITCHLGNGSSISAVDKGKCVDTSMGFTPLEGVMMGTRSGSIDPAIVTFIMENEGLDTKGVDDLLNKESGVLGISRISPDFRDLEAAKKEGNKLAATALDMFSYQVKKYIGAYAAAMGGVDVVVFTAGIGENTASVRAGATEGLEFMGIKLDTEKNKAGGVELDISAEGTKVRVLIVPTNEELTIARDTMEVISK